MKQEDKDLLLKDLCARLPYGVKVRYSSYGRFITCTLHSINPVYNIVNLWSKEACFNPVIIDKIKPYLFPLSSMTEEQKEEYGKCYDIDIANSTKNLNDRIDGKDVINGFPMHNHIDWLNKNHFDYRGLIPMGLAIDCTNLNIY